MNRNLRSLLLLAIIVVGIVELGWIVIREFSSKGSHDEITIVEFVAIGLLFILVALAGSVGLRVLPFRSVDDRENMQVMLYWTGVLLIFGDALWLQMVIRSQNLGAIAMGVLVFVAGIIMIGDIFYTPLTFRSGNNGN